MEFDDSEAVIELHGGAKIFVRENVALTLEGRYYTPLDDFGHVGQLSFVGGLSVYLF